MHTTLVGLNLLEHRETSASRISYFTEGSAVFRGKCTNPDIRVIELDDSSKDSSESEIVALHLPDRRRREIIEVKNGKKSSNVCKNDDDCSPGLICSTYLTCEKQPNASILKRTTREIVLITGYQYSFTLAESVMRRYDETGLMFITIGLTKGGQVLLTATALMPCLKRNEAHGAGNRSSLEGTHNACQDAIPRYHPHCLSKPPFALLRASSVTTDCGLTSAI
ncbi:hypothetical protein G5I_10180 [Acromyrmex echinatior]|uniref:Uncharacterized protein n=1 Tax=Acromyrmex echinatior TaxID=103372 RepID=F4WW26_ACREC|nr:hypothetical protein G5I_10180 [Acromyrmex echinatior]